MIQVQKQMDPVEMSEEIRRRDEQAEHIEKTMLEVNDIYKDLANLVSDQGSMLQSIEANIDDTNSRVEHGLTDLVCGTSARSIPGAENAQDLPRDRERSRACVRARAPSFPPPPPLCRVAHSASAAPEQRSRLPSCGNQKVHG